MTPYHPWRVLRAMTEIEIVWTALPPGVLALRDGSTIWMDPRQRQAQRRSSIAHEIAHVLAGHEGCQPRAIEREVEEEAARRLVAIEDLVSGVQWCRGLHELADELGVDVSIVRARLATLTRSERAAYRAALRGRDDSA